jgi:hypothetical protein
MVFSVMFMFEDTPGQPEASVMVMVYVPPALTLILCVVLVVLFTVAPVLQLTLYGDEPPLMVAVMVEFGPQ